MNMSTRNIIFWLCSFKGKKSISFQTPSLTQFLCIWSVARIFCFERNFQNTCQFSNLEKWFWESSDYLVESSEIESSTNMTNTTTNLIVMSLVPGDIILKSGNKSHMSVSMTKPTKWHVHPVKTDQTGHPPVWSESSRSARRKLGSLTTHKMHSEGRCPSWSAFTLGAQVILLFLCPRSQPTGVIECSGCPYVCTYIWRPC